METTIYGIEQIKKDLIFGDYLGSYVSVECPHGSSVGKLTEIRDGYVFLSPFLNVDYSSGIPIKRMSEGTEVVNLCSLISLKPTTKKSLEEFCKWKNSQEEKSRKDKEIK